MPVSEAPPDSLGRPLRELRLSLTDRCNFRCAYCMPGDTFGPGHRFLPDSALLTTRELVLLASAFALLGVEKARLTGGEPLVRPGAVEIVRALGRDSGLRTLAMTTNGWHLENLAAPLAGAGLASVNVSVDSLDPSTAARLSGVGADLRRVLRGIDAALEAGLRVKANCVLQRGANDGEIEALCAYFLGRGVPLRFIEFMDAGNTNRWSRDRVISADEILERIAAWKPFEPVDESDGNGVATRFRYTDGSGEFGIVRSVSHPFCGDCSRARVSADGRLYTCLFAPLGHDLRPLLRNGADARQLAQAIAAIWHRRNDRYSALRAELLASGRPQPKVEMGFIGG